MTLVKEGALIIDVRTPNEFTSGHAQGAQNYPLQDLKSHLQEFADQGTSIIFCCATGNRSGQATRMAKAEGIPCENGGGWKAVQRMLDQMN